MGDVISWGLINGVKKAVKKVQNTADSLSTTLDSQFEGFIDDATEVVNSLGVGCLPMPLSSAGLRSISTDDGVQLSYTLDTGAMNTDNAALRTEAAAVVLVRNTEHYPTTPADGVQIYEDTDLYTVGDTGTLTPKARTFTDTGLTQNETYYYSAFPRTPGGVYDYSPRDVRHRTKMTWVGNKGTISVNVQTPEGYEGTLGEYTITLVDQAEESPQNVEQTFSGTGVKRMSGLTGGKQYKVRLSNTSDLQAPPDSEVISVVGGQNYDVDMTYVIKYGTITVNVTTTPTGMPIGEYTVTLTPSGGGDAKQLSGNNSQSLQFTQCENGVSYTVSLSAINHYTANANGSVTAVGGQNSSHNVNYEFSATLNDCSWSEINTIAQAGKASQCFSVGDTKQIQMKYVLKQRGYGNVDWDNIYAPVQLSNITENVRLIGFNKDPLTSGGRAKMTFCTEDTVVDFSSFFTSPPGTTVPYFAYGFWRDIDDEGDVMNTGYPYMRMYLQQNYTSILPSDLSPYVKKIRNKTEYETADFSSHQLTGNYTSHQTDDYLFPFCVSNISENTSAGSNIKYDFFTNQSSWVFKDAKAQKAVEWFTRSAFNAYYVNEASWRAVNIFGELGGYSYGRIFTGEGHFYFPLCFCI